jgi:heme-degrading monooxygenase HmoA
MTVYTVGIWTVRPGNEDEFVARWSEFADWTSETFPGGTGVLLRDRERANRFLSFGPWENVEDIERWRAAPEWEQAVAGIRGLLESFEPGTYDVAAESGS